MCQRHCGQLQAFETVLAGFGSQEVAMESIWMAHSTELRALVRQLCTIVWLSIAWLRCTSYFAMLTFGLILSKGWECDSLWEVRLFHLGWVCPQENWLFCAIEKYFYLSNGQFLCRKNGPISAQWCNLNTRKLSSAPATMLKHSSLAEKLVIGCTESWLASSLKFFW